MIPGDAFVGRREELASMTRALRSAREGRPAFVLLTGEPGIGKTAAALEIARRAGVDGAKVAVVRAWEGAGAPAFWLWRECLRELGEALSLPEAIVGDEARFAALEAVAARVRAIASDRWCVLVLDDLQWADVPSLLALRLLTRTARSERLCVLATARDPSDAPADVAAALAALRREGTTIAMAGLPSADLAELARSRGVEDRAAVDAIARATGGNALFALEILGDGEARAALASGLPVPTPRGVRDVLERHLARLTDEASEVIAWCAVGGDPVEPAAVASAAALSPSRVNAAIDVACRERVLLRAGASFRFAHDLVRTAAYERIPHARRAEMHRAFGRVHAERDPNGSAMVHHLFAADPTTTDPDVARAALEAASAAVARLAYEEASSLAARAAQAYERIGLGAELAAALSVLAEARLLGGDAEGSTTDAERAVSVARDSGDAVAFARAALALGLRRRMGLPNAPLVAVLDDALSRLEASGVVDDALLCALEARLAAALQPMLDPPRALSLARAAIARARGSADARVLARTLHAARPAFRMLEPIEERMSIDRELLSIAERLGDHPLAAHAYARLFWASIEGGDRAAADQTLGALADLAARLSLPNHDLAVRQARCVLATLEGRFEDAERAIDEIDATRERWRPASASVLPVDPTVVLRLTIASARGAPLGVSGLPPEVQPVVNVYCDARSGRREQAEKMLAAVADRFLSGEVWYMSRVWLGDACARLGATAYAERLYDLLLPFEGRHVVWTPFPAYDGAVDRILGGLAATRGDRTVALRHYDAAIAMEESLGAIPFAERSRAERQALAPASARVAREDAPRPSFVRDGDTWLVTFGAESARLRDADGLRYLAYLVARPEVSVPVVELFAERAGGGQAAPASGDAGEVLDRTAVMAYRARARDLRDEIDDGEQRNDTGRVERARHELELLEKELARAVGLGGRSRRAGADVERIRVNVTIRIRKAIERLAEHAPRLGRHLGASIRTGTTCVYQPP